jgi:hypothetical protein
MRLFSQTHLLYTELREPNAHLVQSSTEFSFTMFLIIAASSLVAAFLFILTGAFLEIRAAVKFQSTLKTKLGYLAFRQEIKKSEFGQMHRNGRILRALGVLTFAVFLLWAGMHR